jgi:hypothetical protein
MGDILVFAETVEIHAERLQQVLVYCCVWRKIKLNI